jgi:hypothetical protein
LPWKITNAHVIKQVKAFRAISNIAAGLIEALQAKCTTAMCRRRETIRSQMQARAARGIQSQF